MAEQSAPPLCRVGPPAAHASSRAGAPPWAVRAAAPPRRAASSQARALAAPPAARALPRAGAPPWAVHAAAPPRRAGPPRKKKFAARTLPSCRRHTQLRLPRRIATSCRPLRRPNPLLRRSLALLSPGLCTASLCRPSRRPHPSRVAASTCAAHADHHAGPPSRRSRPSHVKASPCRAYATAPTPSASRLLALPGFLCCLSMDGTDIFERLAEDKKGNFTGDAHESAEPNPAFSAMQDQYTRQLLRQAEERSVPLKRSEANELLLAMGPHVEVAATQTRLGTCVEASTQVAQRRKLH